MKTKCLLVDDEPLARQLVATFLKEIDSVEVVGECANAMEAFRMLKETEIDLIFLDINMPQMTGLDFIRSLKNPPKIIIISAYQEYAIEGFELDVVDYLLKPVGFPRLIKAVDKYFSLTNTIQHHELAHTHSSNLEIEEPDFIYVKENKRIVKILVKDIDYIEAMGEYSQIFTSEKKITPKMSISTLEEMLHDKHFIRIHKSIIIPMQKITSFSASLIEIENKKELPIGRTYRKAVLNALQFSGSISEI